MSKPVIRKAPQILYYLKHNDREVYMGPYMRIPRNLVARGNYELITYNLLRIYETSL